VLDIYQSCRSAEEVDRGFAALRADLDGAIETRLDAARTLLFERFDGDVRARLRLAESEARDAVARREAEEEALVRSVFAGGEAPAAGADVRPRRRRGRLARLAADAVRARPLEAVSLLDLDSRDLPASLSFLAGREGWWFAYRFASEGLLPEERVAHLILWSDGSAFHDLAPDAGERFARVPAREAGGGARGAPVAVGAAQEVALARLEARVLAELQARSGAAWDDWRERWDRSVEEGLEAPRRAAAEAREAWERARAGPHQPGELPARDRWGLLERAEREYRRKLEKLRVAEVQRYAEKDRALTELRRRAEPRPRRTLVATAYWRCV
jgi:hypothetical protein